MRVRVLPIFYNRLADALTVEQEVEVVGQRLDGIMAEFASKWDSLPGLPGLSAEWRFTSLLLDGGALIYVSARQVDVDTVELRNITLVPSPT